MKHACKLSALAALVLTGCSGFETFGSSKSVESQSGEVVNAINYFTEEGSEAWLIDCTPTRSECIKRAIQICDGAYSASFLEEDDPLKNTVELEPALEPNSRSGEKMFTMSASCGAA